MFYDSGGQGAGYGERQMANQIAGLVAAIDANLITADEVSRGLNQAQFNWRPEPGRWSIGQCFSHMNIANGLDLGGMERAIADGRARGLTASGPFRYGLLSRKFAESQDLPVKGKIKAPKVFAPPPDVDMEKVVAEYRRNSMELRRLMAAADGLDLVRIKVQLSALPQPLRSIVRMPVGARFLLLTNHDRRHLWQAGEVRKQPGFPGLAG